MAKKALNEEKEVKNKKSSKKKGETKKVSKKETTDTKKSATKKVNHSEKVNDTEKVVEVVVANEEVNASNMSLTQEGKKKNIFSMVLTILVILLIVGAFIISVIETNEKNKYYYTISFNEVSEIMASEETKIIYWASPSCDYCKMFTPVVKEVSYEYKLPFNYLNTSSLTGDQYATMYTYLAAYDETYNSSNLGTPSLILVKNGEIVNISVGYLQEEELIDFLKTNGLIEE